MTIPNLDIFSTTGGRIHGIKLPIIIYGSGSSTSVARACASIGVRDHVLILTDRQVRWLDRVRIIIETLRAAGLSVTVDADRQGRTSINQINNTAATIVRHQAEAIIAIGSGSVIDEAKAAAATARHGSPITDYDGRELIPGPTIPVIAIPTTAGSAAELLPWLVVSVPEHGSTTVVQSSYLQPRIAIVDSALTITLPHAPTASSGIDALAHAIEAFICSRTHPLTRWSAAGALRLILSTLPAVLANTGDSTAREQMMLGQLLAGIAAANSGLTFIHSLAHAAAGVTNKSHTRFIGPLLITALTRMKTQLEPDLNAAATSVLEALPRQQISPTDTLINRIKQTVSAAGVSPLPATDITSLDLIAQHALTIPFTEDSPVAMTQADLSMILAESHTIIGNGR